MSRVDVLEALVNRLLAHTVTTQSLAETAGDLGVIRTGSLYLGSGDPNDLTTSPQGTHIEDNLGIHIYDGTAERIRIGNLINFLFYVSNAYGIAIGDTLTGFLTYDATNGLRLKGASVVAGVYPDYFDIWDEPLLGTPDGVRTVFSTANTAAGGKLQVVQNGIWLSTGGIDYTFTQGSSSFTTTKITAFTDILSANYVRSDTNAPVYNEILTGGTSNFSTAFPMVSGSLILTINGVVQKPVDDYVDGMHAVIFASAPQPGDVLLSGYRITNDGGWRFQEALAGVQDGVNHNFTTGANYLAGTVILVINGVKQTITNDYTEGGTNNISIVAAPQASDSIFVIYHT